MKQTKLFLLDFHEPKKFAASLIFLVAFVAFIWEIGSGLYAGERINIANQPVKLKQQQAIRSDSPLFTHALFGDYVPTNLSAAEIKQSLLDVQIVGIMYSDKEEDSQVIIRTNNNEEQYYVVGDTLPGGAIIKRISTQGVVILHNGSLESLSLPKNELIFDGPAKPLIEE